MNVTMAVSKKAQVVAGLSAVVATLLSLGGQLSLAEHYAQSAPTMYAAGDSMSRSIRMTARSSCPMVDLSRSEQLRTRKDAPNAKLDSTA